MADAPKAAHHAAKEEEKHEHNTPAAEHAQHVVDHSRDVLKEESDGLDEVSGPADNRTGDASESPADHMFSNDPYKKAFPPGPDDLSKAPKHF